MVLKGKEVTKGGRGLGEGDRGKRGHLYDD